MRSKNLKDWSNPELLKVKGPNVPVEDMGRMIDPFLLEDKSEPGKIWCFTNRMESACRTHTIW